LDEVAIGLDEATGRAVSERDVMEAFHRSSRRLLGVELVEGGWSELELQHAREAEPV
jgi:hypothetical protein